MKNEGKSVENRVKYGKSPGNAGDLDGNALEMYYEDLVPPQEVGIWASSAAPVTVSAPVFSNAFV